MGSRKYQNEVWLRGKYCDERLTMGEIGDLCDVTRTTISEWLDRHGIEKRDRREAQLPEGKHTEREWLATQYHGEGRSLSDIAEECNVDAVTIMNWMERHNIPRRGYSDHAKVKRVTIANHPSGYVGAQVREPQPSENKIASVKIHQLIAIANGADPHKVFSGGEYQCHHKNGVKWDNRPENIELLTAAEHQSGHWHEREKADTGELL